MKLVLHDSPHLGPVRRAASPYRAQVVPTWEGEDLEPLELPHPWVVLEVTETSVPLGAVDFNVDLLGGTVFVGYYDHTPLPDWLLDEADMHVHVEQFDDTPRLTQWDAVAVYLHAAFVAMRGR